jgi:hypothetical protein
MLSESEILSSQTILIQSLPGKMVAAVSALVNSPWDPRVYTRLLCYLRRILFSPKMGKAGVLVWISKNIDEAIGVPSGGSGVP